MGKKRLSGKMTGLLGHEITFGQQFFAKLSVKKKSVIYRINFLEITQGWIIESKLLELSGWGGAAPSGNSGTSALPELGRLFTSSTRL